MGNIARLPTGKTWSVATAADAFVDALDNPNTVRGYGTALNAIVDRVGGDRPLALVTDDEIGEALELAWGAAAVNTWYTRRTAVSSWLTWCVERGHDAPSVPDWCRRLPTPDSETPVRSRAAIDRLIARRDVDDACVTAETARPTARPPQGRGSGRTAQTRASLTAITRWYWAT